MPVISRQFLFATWNFLVAQKIIEQTEKHFMEYLSP